MTREEAPSAEQLSRRLVAAGISPTSRRVRVLEELAREPDDATAQVLHRRLVATGESIGLATVYRSLRSFADAGVVDALAHHGDEACYRLCGQDHHHHLTCSHCHRVVELGDCRLDSWLRRSAAAHGFVATGHRLEVTGLCESCRG